MITELDLPVPPAFFAPQSMLEMRRETEVGKPIPGVTTQFGQKLNIHLRNYDDNTMIETLRMQVLNPKKEPLDYPLHIVMEDIMDWSIMIDRIARSDFVTLRRLFKVLHYFEIQNQDNPQSLVDIASLGSWRQTERGLFVAAGFHPDTVSCMKIATKNNVTTHKF